MANELHLAEMFKYLESGESFAERHSADLENVATRDRGTYTGAKPIPFPKAIPRRPSRDPAESPEGYEMRARYWEAAEILRLDLQESKRPPDVWNYIYDPIHLPPSGKPKTQPIRQLGSMPIQRAWRRRCNWADPDLSQTRIVEAMMLYERGEILASTEECSRCREQNGISRKCVISPAICGNACSNCLYDGVEAICDVPQFSERHASRDYDPQRPASEKTQGNVDTRPMQSDYMTVLKLINQMKQSRTSEPKASDARTRAKQIEEAALQVARAAHEWGRRETEKRNGNNFT